MELSLLSTKTSMGRRALDKYNIDGHKLDMHPERVAQWLGGNKLEVYPIYIEISPSGACNHRCTFCAVDYIGYKPNILSMESLKSAISIMAKQQVRSIMFAGEGEPLLHKGLAQIINYTKSVGIDVAITTNGTLMTPAFIDECIESISWIKISLNAGNAETYAKVHQTKIEDWDKVWKNICYAAHCKVNTTLGIQMVVLPENIDTIEELAMDAKCAGVDYVVLKPYSQHLSSVETAKRYAGLKYESPEHMAREMEKFNDEFFQVITRDKSMQVANSDERSYHKCYSTPFMWAYIMATGDVYGCSAYLLDERFKYGNINEQSFSEIWEGPRREAAIKFVEEKLDISECRKNCRMDKANKYLWDIKHPGEHANFI